MKHHKNDLFALVALAAVLAACEGANDLSSETRCVSAGKREEVCVSTRLSQPVNLHEPVAQTVTVTTRADSDSILVWVESDGRTAVVYDGPTEFRLSTKAGEPTTVTTYLRINTVGFFTFNALAEIEGVTDAALTGLTVEMKRDGGTVVP